MRVVLYIRVSTTEQAEEGYSIRAQRAQLVDYCRVNDYEIVDIYIDEGFSAKDMNRPALKRLLTDAQKGLFDAVVVYKLDRFTRSVKDLYTLLDYLNKHNVGFISKQEKFDTTTAMGRAMIGLLAVFAQFERELIAERVRMGQEQKVKEGKKPGGKYPYGYDKEGNEIAEEFVVIRRLRELYMSGTMGFKTIAIQLNREGLTRRGFDWRASTAALTLENPFYAGIIQFGGKLSNGKYPQRKRELRVEVIRSFGNHQPVWTEDEYNEHLALMRQRTDSGYSRKLEYWFTGLLRCGRCGAAMHGRLSTSRVRSDGSITRTPYYICNSRKENDKCSMPIFRQSHIEHLLMQHISGLRDNEELSEIEKRQFQRQQMSIDKTVQKLKRDMEGIKERVKKWQYMFVEGMVDPQDLRKRLDEEYERESELKVQIEKLQQQDKESPELQLELFRVAEIWRKLGDDEKKISLSNLFQEIKLNTDEVNPKGVKNRFFDASIQVKYK